MARHSGLGCRNPVPWTVTCRLRKYLIEDRCQRLDPPPCDWIHAGLSCPAPFGQAQIRSRRICPAFPAGMTAFSTLAAETIASCDCPGGEAVVCASQSQACGKSRKGGLGALLPPNPLHAPRLMRTVTRPRVSPGRRVTAPGRHSGFSGFDDTRLTRPTGCLRP